MLSPAAAVIPTAAVLTAALLGSAGPAVADTPGTLTVQGTGQVFVTPDVASLTVDVNREAPTARLALGAANARLDAITSGLRGIGVPASGLQTSGVNVSRVTRTVGPRHHRRTLHAWSAQESVSVTAPAPLAGRIVDVATAQGASDVGGVSFSFSDQSVGQTAANRAAITDAQRQADAAASQLGETVTGVQSIVLGPSPGVPTPVSSGSSAAAAPKSTVPTVVSPGTQEVDATVEVVFTIAPAH